MKVEECPQCGAPAKLNSKKCEYCKAEYIICSISSLANIDKSGVEKYINHYKGLLKSNQDDGEALLSLGVCYLKLQNYQLSQKYLEKAIELMPDVPDVYYYYALTLIKGRRLKTLSMKEVTQILENINTAIQMNDSNPNYDFLAAMVKNDYFITNGMNEPLPSCEDHLQNTNNKIKNENEIEQLIKFAPVSDDSILKYINN